MEDHGPRHLKSAILNHLSSVERLVLVLIYHEKLNLHEIAGVLDRSCDEVIHIVRAMEGKLQTVMSPAA